MTRMTEPRLIEQGTARLAGDFGGKGTGLAQLAAWGMPIPATLLFDANELHDWVRETLGGHELLDAAAMWRDAGPSLAQLRERILSATPPDNWSALWPTFSDRLALGAGDSLIVRSSMSVEDSAVASFAGCFASIVTDNHEAKIWNAVKHVIASAYSETAVRQLLTEGIDPRSLKPSFILQKYLRSEISGVCLAGSLEWSREPEGVVRGTAATFRANRRELAPSELWPFWSQLWQLVDKIEDGYAGPVDVEWVWSGVSLRLVQARAVATAEAKLFALSRGKRRWSRELTLERFPEAITPMGWSVLQDVLVPNLSSLRRWFGIIVKRPEEMALRYGSFIYSDPEFFRFPGGVHIEWRRYLSPFRRTLWRLLLVPLRLLARGASRKAKALARLELVVALLGDKARELSSTWTLHRDAGLAELVAFRDSLDGPAATNEASLLPRMEEFKGISARFLEPDLAIFLIKDNLYRALEKTWLAFGGDSLSFSRLFATNGRLKQNRTLEMNRDWMEWISALRRDPAHEIFLRELAAAHTIEAGRALGHSLGAEAREAWNFFLTRNGHSTTSWDVFVSSWNENPSQLASLVEAYLKKQSPDLAPAVFRDGAIASPPAGWLSSGLVAKTLPLLEAFIEMDEEQHFLSGRLLEPSRKFIRQAAQRLVASGRLSDTEEVFFLELGELKRALREPGPTLHFLARKRRAEWERARVSTPPFEIGSPPAPLSAPKTEKRNANTASSVFGVPVSPGIARGPIHVVEHLTDAARIPSGAILVTTSPNPALAPLYPMLGGLITATGGPLSHGFITAREYGLPGVSCVVASAFLTPGTWVQIDGTTGRIDLVGATT